jgi:hypothetical protein
MKTTTRRTAAVVAAGVVGLGGLAVAAPALANAGPFALCERSGFAENFDAHTGRGQRDRAYT